MYRIRLYIVPEENGEECADKDNSRSQKPCRVRVNNSQPVAKEFDLEHKIDLEIKMREGVTKLLAACRHQTQTLEAAKNLVTSNERMSAYMAELQRRKRDLPARPSGIGCKARVCLSDLRMPLIWRDTDHFKNKGDYRRFAVFCLARVGTEVYDTSLLCPVDRSLTDLTFPDIIVFNNIPADFTFQLEVYSHILQDDLSIASTSRKIKKTIHSSISRTVGKKLAASLRDELNSGKIGPHFELMASARLTLDDVHDGCHTHDLKLECPEVRSHQLPLFGHFCCRLAAQPECLSGCVSEGPLRPRGAREAAWARLQGSYLSLWPDRTAWLTLQPCLINVQVDKNTVIRPIKSSKSELEIVNESGAKDEAVVLKADSGEERDQWVRHLQQHVINLRRWKSASEKVMEMYNPGSGKQLFSRPSRQGSLYDETPLIETIQPSDSYRPTVQEIFGLTPSTSLSSCSSSSSPTFRERSLSSSGSAKSRSVRGNSHWPFTRND